MGIVVADTKNFEELKSIFKKEGLDKIHVLADFDRTLTKAFVNGKSVASLISVLRDENYLTPDYPEKAKALYEKYHAIEKDPSCPIEEKKTHMKNWWTEHFELLIKSGLTKKDIEKAMESTNLSLREGAEEFLEILKNSKMPLVVLSSSGLGVESIGLFLEKRGLFFENIYIISNSFEWDNNGTAVSVKQPIIHGMNKNETSVKRFPAIFEQVKNRKNILLLGDSLNDAEMAEGFDYRNILKIGFLNEDIEQNLSAYSSAFDAVLTGDSSLGPVNTILRQIG